MPRMSYSVVTLAFGMLASVAADGQNVPNAPTGPIERKYYADGPFTVAEARTSEPCDHKGNNCNIWYPSELKVKRPVILWANGTQEGRVPAGRYGYLLRHLASWGFVVVATEDGKTGYGDTVRDVLAYLRATDGDRSSPLSGRIDFRHVGAAGHSQGAIGAVNAMIKSNGAIRTAVSFQIPAQMFCSPADNCLLTPTLTGATSGSVFYVSGTADAIISPDRQLGGTALNSLTAYYDATPASLIKAKGLVKGANHDDIRGTPACELPVLCTFGVYGYLGLPTAWLAWQLQGDRKAGAAFEQGGEFFTAKAWTGQQTNAR